MKYYFIYILTNKKCGVLYIGVTSNLERRMYEHRNGLIEGFSRRYHLKMLVYYEMVADAASAIEREKRLKKWSRKWKIELIEKMNPEWHDLYSRIA